MAGATNTWRPNIPADLKYLLLHESPGEVKTVNTFLPKGFMAMATIGHFLKTSSSELDLDIDTWELNLKPDSGKKDVLKNIQDALDVVRKNGGKVILCGDGDREGQVINYEIIKHFKLKKDEYVVHANPASLAEKEYMTGVLKPKSLDMNVVESGLGRQALDKYVGFLMTQFLWDTSSSYKGYLEGIKTLIAEKVAKFESKNVEILKTNKSVKKIIDSYKTIDFDRLNEFEERKGTSFGRVQTASLILLVLKEFEKFDKEFERKLNIQALDGKDITWEYSRNEELEKNEGKMREIYNRLKGELDKKIIKKITVKDIKSKVQKLSPLTTLDTLEAQTALGNTFGYSVDELMSILQKLYEGGLTTYMRTDTTATKQDVTVTDLSAYEEYIQEMVQTGTSSDFIYRLYKKDSAQAGHVGILPTQVYDIKNLKSIKTKEGRALTEDEFIVFEYVVKRTVAAFMSDAKIQYCDYILEVELSDGVKEEFIVKDSFSVEEGFLEVFRYNIDKYTQKIFYKIGETINIKDFLIREKDIKLPGGYTESGFVAELEKNGIGRPSTWGSIISTLKDKNYIKIKDKKIEVTPKGYWVMQVVTQDSKQFGRFKDTTFTSQMESDLDLIATGKRDKKSVLDGIRSEVESITASVVKKTASGPVVTGESFGMCPSCKKGTIEKKTIGDKTNYGCSSWREGCKFSLFQTVAGYTFSEEEIIKAIKNKETEFCVFKSKLGKDFTAKLVFEKGKGFQFEFQNTYNKK